MPKYHGMEKRKTKKGIRYYPYVDFNKTRYRAGHGFETAEDARNWRGQKRLELERGFIPDSSITFAEYASHYLDKKKNQVRKSTLLTQESRIRVHIIPYIGDIKLLILKPAHIEQIQSRLLRTKSQSYASTIMSTLRHMLANAVDNEIIPKNPALKVKLPRIPKRESSILTPEELSLLLYNAPIRERTIIALGGLAGLRIGEVFFLRWKDVNLNDGTISINGSYGPYGFTEPKTETSKTTIPIIPELITILKEWRLGSPSARWVFPSEKGDMPISNIPWRKNHYYPLLEKVGLSKIRFHDLRHTFISILLAKGVNPRDVQSLARHASLIQTNKYSHEIKDRLQGVVKELRIVTTKEINTS